MSKKKKKIIMILLIVLLILLVISLISLFFPSKQQDRSDVPYSYNSWFSEPNEGSSEEDSVIDFQQGK